ncbi:DNA cytosine methyltransferase [Rhodococcus sp. T7]|uniref:DNA cytosine methyltransferase n=1 Tax=Rhodococcus sp. T7 TaxID=627444 RepID=UPI00135A31B2|nr:DNA (cytosine-5-)-methyltransferase [Rhodococcus sp. T7]
MFAGIGGVEVGLAKSGVETISMVENWEPARAVLAHRFSHAELLNDVATVKTLPRVDILTAGFPCTDLSQAGRTQGIRGSASGLVSHVFRLLPKARPTWLVLENVRNMLALDGGQAMMFLVQELESRGYNWAYRLIDSRSTGVPQRRQRVILVASRTEDPRAVLFADDATERDVASYDSTAFGFYWTEGLKGLGWAPDAVPTLKGGSSLGIPSPPAIWIPDAPLGRRVVTPTIEDAEALQGFRRGWTRASSPDGRRNGPRWKLVGNAVTTGVSTWVGSRLVTPGAANLTGQQRLEPGGRWPIAAYGASGEAWSVPVSMWPVRKRYKHLLDVVNPSTAVPLSARATAGFLERTERSSLRFDSEFLVAMKEHLRTVTEQRYVGAVPVPS